jgi:alkanesulfonate monooxygenase SsuD/methylene tetrahydromethanopterin reductase-like flavin-dependent oxidoreductase (luciferase family)
VTSTGADRPTTAKATVALAGVTPPSFGFVAPADPVGVRDLERAGASSLWVGGHVASVNPTPEPMVWLARLIEQTESATVGTATLCLPLYPPALVAKQVADLDRASGGRVALGIGIGGEYPSDFSAMDVPREERGSRADEAIGLLRRFWTAEPVEHQGPHYHFDGIRIHPPPDQDHGPPIIVCGRREGAMHRAARLGDGWMPYLYSPRRYAESVEKIVAFASDSDRDLDNDFGWFAYLMVAIDEDADAARRGAASFLRQTYRQDVEPLIDRITVAGSPEDVGEQIAAFVAAGARHLVFCPIHGDMLDSAGRLLEEVLPGL